MTVRQDDLADYVRLLRDENARLKAAIDNGLREEREALEAERIDLDKVCRTHYDHAVADFLGRHDWAVEALRRVVRFLMTLPADSGAADLIADYRHLIDDAAAERQGG